MIHLKKIGRNRLYIEPTSLYIVKLITGKEVLCRGVRIFEYRLVKGDRRNITLLDQKEGSSITHYAKVETTTKPAPKNSKVTLHFTKHQLQVLQKIIQEISYLSEGTFEEDAVERYSRIFKSLRALYRYNNLHIFAHMMVSKD